jgi:hypothetical protein
MAAIDYVATITVDDTKATDQISVDPDTISTAPDKHIVFVVLNVGTNKHKVTVHRDRFHQTSGPPNSPDTPIRFFGRFSDNVDPGDVGALILRVRDQDDFGGAPGGRVYKYKYTIEASDLPDYDPDIDINN